ncbi:hypothetical protein NQD34_013120 [Periophthalmus magnuspinnatus]|nr:hypothetical protein NQD34_013120 [Periophthalmus magnuspinnatus]
MSKHQTLRALVTERLTAAAEEIFALFERTIADYEEELCRSKEENQRNQESLDSVLSPRLELLRSEVQILSVESLECPGSDRDTPRIKEEPEEQSVKQEKDTLTAQLPVGVAESSSVCLKSGESSLLQQRQTEAREETQGEDISTEPHLHTEIEGHTEYSSDTDNDEDWTDPFSCSAAQMETEADGDHYNQVQKAQTLRALVNEQLTMAAEEMGLNQDTPQTPWIKEEPEEQSVKQKEEQLPVGVAESSSVCLKSGESSLLQQRQTEAREETQGEDISTEPHLHPETKGHTEYSSDTDNYEYWRDPFSCSAAQMETEADGDHYNQVQIRATSTAPCSGLFPINMSAPETRASLNNGDLSRTAERAEGNKHQCFVCKKRLGSKQNLQRHIRVHTGEKPFSCSACEKSFSRRDILAAHERTHTGERPYTCCICYKGYTHRHHLKKHMRTHMTQCN